MAMPLQGTTPFQRRKWRAQINTILKLLGDEDAFRSFLAQIQQNSAYLASLLDIDASALRQKNNLAMKQMLEGLLLQRIESYIDAKKTGSPLREEYVHLQHMLKSEERNYNVIASLWFSPTDYPRHNKSDIALQTLMTSGLVAKALRQDFNQDIRGIADKMGVNVEVVNSISKQIAAFRAQPFARNRAVREQAVMVSQERVERVHGKEVLVIKTYTEPKDTHKIKDTHKTPENVELTHEEWLKAFNDEHYSAGRRQIAAALAEHERDKVGVQTEGRAATQLILDLGPSNRISASRKVGVQNFKFVAREYLDERGKKLIGFYKEMASDGELIPLEADEVQAILPIFKRWKDEIARDYAYITIDSEPKQKVGVQVESRQQNVAVQPEGEPNPQQKVGVKDGELATSGKERQTEAQKLDYMHEFTEEELAGRSDNYIMNHLARVCQKLDWARDPKDLLGRLLDQNLIGLPMDSSLQALEPYLAVFSRAYQHVQHAQPKDMSLRELVEAAKPLVGSLRYPELSVYKNTAYGIHPQFGESGLNAFVVSVFQRLSEFPPAVHEVIDRLEKNPRFPKLHVSSIKFLSSRIQSLNAYIDSHQEDLMESGSLGDYRDQIEALKEKIEEYEASDADAKEDDGVSKLHASDKQKLYSHYQSLKALVERYPDNPMIAEVLDLYLGYIENYIDVTNIESAAVSHEELAADAEFVQANDRVMALKPQLDAELAFELPEDKRPTIANLKVVDRMIALVNLHEALIQIAEAQPDTLAQYYADVAMDRFKELRKQLTTNLDEPTLTNDYVDCVAGVKRLIDYIDTLSSPSEKIEKQRGKLQDAIENSQDVLLGLASTYQERYDEIKQLILAFMADFDQVMDPEWPETEEGVDQLLKEIELYQSQHYTQRFQSKSEEWLNESDEPVHRLFVEMQNPEDRISLDASKALLVIMRTADVRMGEFVHKLRAEKSRYQALPSFINELKSTIEQDWAKVNSQNTTRFHRFLLEDCAQIESKLNALESMLKKLPGGGELIDVIEEGSQKAEVVAFVKEKRKDIAELKNALTRKISESKDEDVKPEVVTQIQKRTQASTPQAVQPLAVQPTFTQKFRLNKACKAQFKLLGAYAECVSAFNRAKDTILQARSDQTVTDAAYYALLNAYENENWAKKVRDAWNEASSSKGATDLSGYFQSAQYKAACDFAPDFNILIDKISQLVRSEKDKYSQPFLLLGFYAQEARVASNMNDSERIMLTITRLVNQMPVFNQLATDASQAESVKDDYLKLLSAISTLIGKASVLCEEECQVIDSLFDMAKDPIDGLDQVTFFAQLKARTNAINKLVSLCPAEHRVGSKMNLDSMNISVKALEDKLCASLQLKGPLDGETTIYPLNIKSLAFFSEFSDSLVLSIAKLIQKVREPDVNHATLQEAAETMLAAGKRFGNEPAFKFLQSHFEDAYLSTVLSRTEDFEDDIKNTQDLINETAFNALKSEDFQELFATNIDTIRNTSRDYRKVIGGFSVPSVENVVRDLDEYIALANYATNRLASTIQSIEQGFERRKSAILNTPGFEDAVKAWMERQGVAPDENSVEAVVTQTLERMTQSQLEKLDRALSNNRLSDLINSAQGASFLLFSPDSRGDMEGQRLPVFLALLNGPSAMGHYVHAVSDALNSSPEQVLTALIAYNFEKGRLSPQDAVELLEELRSAGVQLGQGNQNVESMLKAFIDRVPQPVFPSLSGYKAMRYESSAEKLNAVQREHDALKKQLNDFRRDVMSLQANADRFLEGRVPNKKVKSHVGDLISKGSTFLPLQIEAFSERLSNSPYATDKLKDDFNNLIKQKDRIMSDVMDRKEYQETVYRYCQENDSIQALLQSKFRGYDPAEILQASIAALTVDQLKQWVVKAAINPLEDFWLGRYVSFEAFDKHTIMLPAGEPPSLFSHIVREQARHLTEYMNHIQDLQAETKAWINENISPDEDEADRVKTYAQSSAQELNKKLKELVEIVRVQKEALQFMEAIDDPGIYQAMPNARDIQSFLQVAYSELYYANEILIQANNEILKSMPLSLRDTPIVDALKTQDMPKVVKETFELAAKTAIDNLTQTLSDRLLLNETLVGDVLPYLSITQMTELSGLAVTPNQSAEVILKALIDALGNVKLVVNPSQGNLPSPVFEFLNKVAGYHDGDLNKVAGYHDGEWKARFNPDTVNTTLESIRAACASCSGNVETLLTDNPLPALIKLLPKLEELVSHQAILNPQTSQAIETTKDQVIDVINKAVQGLNNERQKLVDEINRAYLASASFGYIRPNVKKLMQVYEMMNAWSKLADQIPEAGAFGAAREVLASLNVFDQEAYSSRKKDFQGYNTEFTVFIEHLELQDKKHNVAFIRLDEVKDARNKAREVGLELLTHPNLYQDDAPDLFIDGTIQSCYENAATNSDPVIAGHIHYSKARLSGFYAQYDCQNILSGIEYGYIKPENFKHENRTLEQNIEFAARMLALAMSGEYSPHPNESSTMGKLNKRLETASRYVRGSSGGNAPSENDLKFARGVVSSFTYQQLSQFVVSNRLSDTSSLSLLTQSRDNIKANQRGLKYDPNDKELSDKLNHRADILESKIEWFDPNLTSEKERLVFDRLHVYDGDLLTFLFKDFWKELTHDNQDALHEACLAINQGSEAGGSRRSGAGINEGPTHLEPLQELWKLLVRLKGSAGEDHILTEAIYKVADLAYPPVTYQAGVPGKVSTMYRPSEQHVDPEQNDLVERLYDTFKKLLPKHEHGHRRKLAMALVVQIKAYNDTFPIARIDLEKFVEAFEKVSNYSDLREHMPVPDLSVAREEIQLAFNKLRYRNTQVGVKRHYLGRRIQFDANDLEQLDTLTKKIFNKYKDGEPPLVHSIAADMFPVVMMDEILSFFQLLKGKQSARFTSLVRDTPPGKEPDLSFLSSEWDQMKGRLVFELMRDYPDLYLSMGREHVYKAFDENVGFRNLVAIAYEVFKRDLAKNFISHLEKLEDVNQVRAFLENAFDDSKYLDLVSRLVITKQYPIKNSKLAPLLERMRTKMNEGVIQLDMNAEMPLLYGVPIQVLTPDKDSTSYILETMEERLGEFIEKVDNKQWTIFMESLNKIDYNLEESTDRIIFKLDDDVTQAVEVALLGMNPSEMKPVTRLTFELLSHVVADRREVLDKFKPKTENALKPQ